MIELSHGISRLRDSGVMDGDENEKAKIRRDESWWRQWLGWLHVSCMVWSCMVLALLTKTAQQSFFFGEVRGLCGAGLGVFVVSLCLDSLALGRSPTTHDPRLPHSHETDDSRLSIVGWTLWDSLDCP